MTEKTFEKYKLVIDNYLINGFNGVKAYQAVYPTASYNTADKGFRDIHENPRVQEYLSTLKEKQAERTQITKDQLIAELAKIAFFDIRNIHTVDGGLKSIHDFGDDEAAAIAGIETYNEKERETGEVLGTIHKVKISPKIAAIERISKMLGYDAPTEINNTGNIVWHEVKTYDTNKKTNDSA